MAHLRPPWHRINSLALCLFLSSGGGTLAQDEGDYLQFRSIAGEGSTSITVAGGDVYFRLAFDADFRLDPQSNGIHLGDNVGIFTELAYPVMIPQAGLLGSSLNRLVVRLSVEGGCFVPRGRVLLFKAPDGGANQACAGVRIQIFDGDGNQLFDGDFDHILDAVTIELRPVGQRGRWKLRSIASFFNPGFPFPVAGYTYDEVGNRLTSGVTVIVGDDGALSPFRTVDFRTLAP